jgi:hypothetical protein
MWQCAVLLEFGRTRAFVFRNDARSERKCPYFIGRPFIGPTKGGVKSSPLKRCLLYYTVRTSPSVQAASGCHWVLDDWQKEQNDRGPKANHSPPSSFEVKNLLNRTFSPSYIPDDGVFIKNKENFTF